MRNVILAAKKIMIPSKKLRDEKDKIANKIFELVKNNASKYNEIVDVEFGGSYAKDTWLPDKADIDIFIKFKKSVTEKSFIKISKQVGFGSLKHFSPYVRYSEHPYVEAIVNKTRVNIVPCYDVQIGEWQSSADRSSFHTKLMVKELSEEMKEEVRLLKGFFKANKIYGAEIARGGFSGYVAEVLILQFGNFEKVINKMAVISHREIIGKATKEFDTPIIIMDPIDSNRNLAAAISVENIGRFVLASRAFLKKPSLNFFKMKSTKQNKKNSKNILIIKFHYSYRAPDIIWGQIKRSASAISVQLELHGFKVLRKTTTTDEDGEANIIFMLESIHIPKIKVKEGPEFFSENDVDKFIAKNSKKSNLMWINQDLRIIALHNRHFTDAKKFLQNLLKKELSNSGIPKGLHRDIKKGFSVSGTISSSKSIKEAIGELTNTDEKIFYCGK